MNFTDPVFFLFLPLVLSIVYLVRWKSKTSFNVLMIVSSSIFYGYWDYRFLVLLFYSTVIDYYAGLKIAGSENVVLRKKWLVFSIVSNLGLLFYFKYCNFFIDNLRLLGIQVEVLNIILPVGISFYTFQTMSYSIDVYRREILPEKSFLNFLYYTIFFPQLVAGPIVRAIEFLPQVQKIPEVSFSKIKFGASIFVLGLIKKVLLANSIAPFVDQVFNDPTIYSSWTIWYSVIGYSLQIYFDFSGYTDMAIGISHMFGHSLVENFNLPYISRSVTDFWRRWHMSLSRWIKDYIYISLGGSRKGKYRTYINLIITMMLGGLWHGASWNFVIWGSLHGLALSFEKFFHLDKRFLNGYISFVRWILTIVFVMITWVFFRAKDLSSACIIIERMFFIHNGIDWFQFQLGIVLFFTVLGHLVSYFYIRKRFKYFILDLDKFWSLTLFLFVILGLLLLNPKYHHPFIYFQF